MIPTKIEEAIATILDLFPMAAEPAHLIAIAFVVWITWRILKTHWKYNLCRIGIDDVQNGLEEIKTWERNNLDFNMGSREQTVSEKKEDTEEEIDKKKKEDDISKSVSQDDDYDFSQGTMANRWLRYFKAQFRQNKPPDCSIVMASIEDKITEHDEEFRTLSGSLTVLGLLGTFIGLLIVVLPIAGVIQNTRFDEMTKQAMTGDAPLITTFNTILDGLDKSVKGMPVAFFTSILGLGGTLFFNGRFSKLHKVRIALLGKMEDYLNGMIAPKFAQIPHEVRLADAFLTGSSQFMASAEISAETAHIFNECATSVNSSAEQITEAAREFNRHIKNFKRLSRPIESLQQSSETMATQLSDMMTKQAESLQQNSKRMVEQLTDLMKNHSESLQQNTNTMVEQLTNLTETRSESLQQSSKTMVEKLSEMMKNHSESFQQDSKRMVEKLTDLTENRSESLQQSSKTMVEQLMDMMKKQFEGFDSRMEMLGSGLNETLDTLRAMEGSDYNPVFSNIQNLLDSIRGAQEALLKLYQASIDEQENAITKAAEPVHSGLDLLCERMESQQKQSEATVKTLRKGVNNIRDQIQTSQQALVSAIKQTPRYETGRRSIGDAFVPAESSTDGGSRGSSDNVSRVSLSPTDTGVITGGLKKDAPPQRRRNLFGKLKDRLSSSQPSKKR